MRTSELSGPWLDYFVAKAEHGNTKTVLPYAHDWAHGGPIIERERIGVIPFGLDGLWLGSMPGDVDYYAGVDGADGKLGPTLLIAAMRAYVASKFGEEVIDKP